MAPLALTILALCIGLCACAPAPIDTPPAHVDFKISCEAEVTLDTAKERLEGVAIIRCPAPYDECEEIWLWSRSKVTEAIVEGQAAVVERQDVYTRIALPKKQAMGEELTVEVHFGTDAKRANLYECRNYLPLPVDYREGYERPTCTYTEVRRLAAGTASLTLHTKKGLVVAMSGDELQRSHTQNEQILTCTFSTRDDIALVANADWMRQEVTVGDTTWEYYCDTRTFVAQTLAAAVQNARTLGGECARKRVAVVQGCSMVADGLVGLRDRDDGTIVDAVVGQWVCYKLTADAPWVGASLGQFVLYLYLKTYREADADAMLRTAKEDALAYTVRYGANGEAARLDKPIDAYDEDAYHALLQQKGLLLWATLWDIGGDKVCEAAVDCGRLPYPDTGDVLAQLRKCTGRDYTYYLDAWLGGKVPIV